MEAMKEACLEAKAAPPTQKVGWLPFAMLGYLGLFFVQPATSGGSVLDWLLTIAGGLACAGLYIAAFVTHGWRQRCVVAAIVVLGLVYVPFNAAALVFFIYASLLIPHTLPSRAAFGWLVALVALILAQAFWLHLPIEYWLTASLCSAVAGIINVNVVQRQRAYAKLYLAREEVESLAKIAERERIARDLHDVLGHTMSVIVLKSELAAKLVDRDPARARSEIADIERIGRDALAEIRETIRGYRSNGLAAEITRARETLETAGVGFECSADASGLPPAEENVLALIVREAVTNVVRHARARTCRLAIARDEGTYALEIADDGRGGAMVEGNGLRGMRERVEALGGSIDRINGRGTTIRVAFPTRGNER